MISVGCWLGVVRCSLRTPSSAPSPSLPFRSDRSGKIDDAASRGRGSDVGADRTLRTPMTVAFDAKTKLAFKGAKLGQADGAESRATEAQVGETPRDVLVVRINLGQQPGGGADRIEQLDDREGIVFARGAFDQSLASAVLFEFGELPRCEQFHDGSPMLGWGAGRAFLARLARSHTTPRLSLETRDRM